MKNKFFILILLVSSCVVRADYTTNDVEDNKYQVFDESIRLEKYPNVLFYFRYSGNYKKTIVSQKRFNCTTKYSQYRDNESQPWSTQTWTPTDSVGRSMGEYACSYLGYLSEYRSASPSESKKEVNPSNSSESSESSPKGWISDFGNDVIGLLTTEACTSKLKDLGFQYEAGSSIPLSRLKNKNEAFAVSKERAITVEGCWSPKMGKAVFHRKKDDKVWAIDIDISDGTWMPVD